MTLRSMYSFIFCACLLAGSAAAQGKPPAGPPPGGSAPGGPPPGGGRGPGGPGNNGGAPAPGASGGSSASGSVPHFGPVGRWWDDKSVVQTVGLSHAQQKQMDTIFDANKSAILSTYKTFLAEQAKLNALSKQTQVDQAQMFAAIDAVSQAKAALQKANTQMLLQIRQQMKPEQIDKLEKLQ